MLDEKSNIKRVDHYYTLKSRDNLTIFGVTEILNFDEKSVSLKTTCGEMAIDGDNIHIDILNIEKGEVAMRGKINGVNYYDNTEVDKHSLLSRIFR